MARFRRLFKAAGRPDRARGEKAYLKSPLDFHGVTAPFLHQTTRTFKREHPGLARVDLVRLVRALWATRYHDLRSLGIVLLDRYVDRLTVGDLSLVEQLLRRSTTWDHADGLSVKVAGSLVARDARTKRTLVRWSRDEHMWLRRASLLALLVPLRAGGGNFTLFARLAASLVHEREFFIRKAIGWVLREVSKKRPALTYAFLVAYRARVSGLTLREGAKYLPARDRARLLGGAR